MTVKITSRHEADLKNRESQYECDLAMQAAKFEDEKRALTLRFKNEICDLRKVLYLLQCHVLYLHLGFKELGEAQNRYYDMEEAFKSVSCILLSYALYGPLIFLLLSFLWCFQVNAKLVSDANSYISCTICYERCWDSALKCGHCFCIFCLHTMTPGRTVQCPICRGRPERQPLQLRTDFPDTLMATTAICDIHPSQSGITSDVATDGTTDVNTPSVNSNAADEPGPSHENLSVLENIAAVANDPEIETNSDVTDFINDGDQGERPDSTNDAVEEIYNNEASPDIIFY